MPTYGFNLAWRISGALDSETLLIYHLLKNIFILSLATEMVFRFPRDGLLSNRKVVSKRGKKSEKSAKNQFRDLRPRDRANMGSLTALMTDS